MSNIIVLFNYLTTDWGNFIPPAIKQVKLLWNDEFITISVSNHSQ